MIRSGDFTTYNNKEYSFFKKQDGSVNLISYDSDALLEGFKKHDRNANAFVKNVGIDEIHNPFLIKTHGKYKNEEINVRTEKGDSYHIGTSDAEIAKKLDMDRTDKYYYEKWIPKEEVELFEVRKPITL